MIVLDSSMWIAFFTGTKNGKKVRELLKNSEEIVSPSICYYEVYKILSRELGKGIADTSIEFMDQHSRSVLLDHDLAIYAAQIHTEFNLAMADSLIYASAIVNKSMIWTQDSDFEGLEFVRLFQR